MRTSNKQTIVQVFAFVSLLIFVLEEWSNAAYKYCMPMYACQLWSKSTQNTWSAYVLRITMSIASCITYPETCVRSHQVSYCVRTFDALL